MYTVSQICILFHKQNTPIEAPQSYASQKALLLDPKTTASPSIRSGISGYLTLNSHVQTFRNRFINKVIGMSALSWETGSHYLTSSRRRRSSDRQFLRAFPIIINSDSRSVLFPGSETTINGEPTFSVAIRMFSFAVFSGLSPSNK